MTTCAADGCDNPVPERITPGRPYTYCSPQCRPSHHRYRYGTLQVEINHPVISDDGRPAERVWSVRLRRGRQTLLIATSLGWPTANAPAHELNDILFPGRKQEPNTTH